MDERPLLRNGCRGCLGVLVGCLVSHSLLVGVSVTWGYFVGFQRLSMTSRGPVDYGARGAKNAVEYLLMLNICTVGMPFILVTLAGGMVGWYVVRLKT